MTPLEIRDAIVSHINTNWTATPIAWENKPFDPTGLLEWIRPTIIGGSSFVGENAVRGAGWRNGVLIISVFTAKDKGERRGLSLASDLEDLFGMEIISSVIFDQPQTKPIGVSDAWTQHNVSVPFSVIIEY